MPHLRFSRQIFRILLLLALAAGVAGAPSRLAAQAAANPEATSQSAGQSTAQPEKKSQEEQETVFRLEGPVVKWTAKTFNLSQNTTANIFEGINFAIIVFGIGIPLFRFLPKFLRTRTETVRADIESARKATEEANARLSAIEAKLCRPGRGDCRDSCPGGDGEPRGRGAHQGNHWRRKRAHSGRGRAGD